MHGYPVPAARTRVEIRVSNSRFLATIARADSMSLAQVLLEEIRGEMPDANHHVYAFRIGYGASVKERLSDDGEPSGTAGPPAMAVVRGQDIGDVALVITRYFGGTKLGTGGLVAAYTRAAQVGFEELATEPRITWIAMQGAVPYALLESVRRIVHEFDGRIDSEQFEADVRLAIQLPEPVVPAFQQAIRDRSGGQINFSAADPA